MLAYSNLFPFDVLQNRLQSCMCWTQSSPSCSIMALSTIWVTLLLCTSLINPSQLSINHLITPPTNFRLLDSLLDIFGSSNAFCRDIYAISTTKKGLRMCFLWPNLGFTDPTIFVGGLANDSTLRSTKCCSHVRVHHRIRYFHVYM